MGLRTDWRLQQAAALSRRALSRRQAVGRDRRSAAAIARAARADRADAGLTRIDADRADDGAVLALLERDLRAGRTQLSHACRVHRGKTGALVALIVEVRGPFEHRERGLRRRVASAVGR